MKNPIVKLILPVLVFIVASSVVIFAAPDTDKNIASRLEQRIEKLSSFLANEPAKDINVEKARDLLARASELVKAGKYEEARELTDKVVRMINPEGKEIRDRKRDQSNKNPDRQNFGQKKRDLTDAEKKAIKSEINKMLKDLKNLVDKEKYEEASKLLHEIQIRMFLLSGRKPEMPGRDGKMGMGDQYRGPMKGMGPFQKGREGGGMFGPDKIGKRDQQGPKPGDNIPPGAMKILKSLKQLSDQYIEKHGEDNFIKKCREDFLKIVKDAKSGNTTHQEALEKLESLREKIKKEL